VNTNNTCSLALALLGALGFASASAHGKDPPFKITTRKADDAIQVEMEKDKVLFGVGSRSGIGDATIERLDDAWPDSARFKIYLKGLDQFQIDNGSVILEIAVGSDGSQRVSLIKNGKTSAVDRKSPYWLEVQSLDADGKPTKDRPLKNGWFEMTLPKAMLDGNPKTLKLKWIDFFRT
jgi:hypothetical protein